MAADEAMTLDERRKYLKQMRGRSCAADRAQRGVVLTAMEPVPGVHRTSLTRRLNGAALARRPRQRQRGRASGAGVRAVVAPGWARAADSCAARRTPTLVPTARHLAAFGARRLTPAGEERLGTISRATVRRMPRTMARPAPRLPRTGPEEANRRRRAVPRGRLRRALAEPGHVEVELVHRCGGSATGAPGHTLSWATWPPAGANGSRRWGRSDRARAAGFRRLLGRVPFPVVELHPDNGSACLNDHLVRCWGEQISGLRPSRGRPYHKNDTRRVAQKHDTLVRADLGYGRLEGAAQTTALDRPYERLWLYDNLFQPVLHLREKRRTDGKLRRRGDTATSPDERPLATGVLDDHWRATLDTRHAQTNPRQLRRTSYAELAQLSAPGTTPAVPAA